MAFTGDLGSIELANVFQMLLLSQKTGTLAIRSREARREVYFDGECVLLPFDRDAYPTKVVKSLERSGAVSAEQVARARASLGVVESDLFTILLSMRAVTAEQVSAAWRTQMEEEIYELFVDREASFEFREGEPPSLPGKLIDERFRLPGNSLLMEAARRIDEWSFIRERVPSDRCVLEVAPGASTLPDSVCDESMTTVVSGVDGVSPVAAIVARTGLSRFTVSKKLALLVEMRAAYEVPRETLLKRAREFLGSDRAEAGLPLLERALELGADDAAAHEMAALAHQALGRIGEACRHLSQVADALERGGQRRQAAEVHLRVRDLLPTDVRCRERLVHHWLDDPTFFKSTRYSGVDEALELAVILREIGRSDAARTLLKELAGPFASSPRLIGKLVDVAIELGDAKLAVELLISGGDALLGAGQPAIAARLYRRVRTIDPQHPGLPEKLGRCEGGSATRLLTSGAVMRAVATVVVMAGLGLGLCAYNQEALAAFAALPVEELAVAGDFAGARRELDSLRDEYPVSVATLLSARLDRQLDARDQRVAAEAQERRALLSVDSARRQKIAERALADAIAELRRGERTVAQALFARAAAQATDVRFLAAEKPAEKARELAAQFALERADAAAYVAARAAGDWARMRELAVVLAGRRPLSGGLATPVLFPVRLSVDPPDATLTVDPPPLADGVLEIPIVVLLPAGSTSRLRASGAGLFAIEREIVPEAGFEVHIRLDRAPAQTSELAHRVRFVPIADGPLVYAACDDGRIVALDACSLESRWEKRLPDLDAAAGPPARDEVGVRVDTRSGTTAWFDPVTGEIVQQQPLRTEVPAAAAGSTERELQGGHWLRAGDGSIRQFEADGSETATWRAPGRAEWSLAVEGAVLFGGGNWIVRIVPDRAPVKESIGGGDR